MLGDISAIKKSADASDELTAGTEYLRSLNNPAKSEARFPLEVGRLSMITKGKTYERLDKLITQIQIKLLIGFNLDIYINVQIKTRVRSSRALNKITSAKSSTRQ